MTYSILLQVQTLPSEFFTLQSMLTLTGATGAVFVISNGLQRAFDFNPKWLALLIAQILSIVGVFITTEASISDFFVGIVNGFLIYSTAVGVNQITGDKNPPNQISTRSVAPEKQIKKRSFNSTWF
jgi:hypothetical protein